MDQWRGRVLAMNGSTLPGPVARGQRSWALAGLAVAVACQAAVALAYGALLWIGRWLATGVFAGLSMALGPTGTVRLLELISDATRLLVDVPSRSAVPLTAGVLGLLAAVGLYREWLAGWVLATFVQSIHLLFAILAYHSLDKPRESYLAMVLAIILVFYLNSPDVLHACGLGGRRQRGEGGLR